MIWLIVLALLPIVLVAIAMARLFWVPTRKVSTRCVQCGVAGSITVLRDRVVEEPLPALCSAPCRVKWRSRQQTLDGHE